MKAGDLVVHLRGWIYPYGRIRGVVIECGLKDRWGADACKVFWYTTQNYQVVRTEILIPLEQYLDEEPEPVEEKNGE